MCDACCGPNCDGLCNCYTAGIKTECATTTSEVILTFLGCLTIELGFELGWHDDSAGAIESWLKESLISSGISATYAVVISSVLRIMHHKYNNDESLYCYASGAITQLLSGGIAFGIGMLFDFALHNKLDELEASTEVALSTVLPVVIVGAKVLSRIGLFKSIDVLKSYCHRKQGHEDLDKHNLKEIENTSVITL